jgi:hypothetical protein
MIRAAFLVALLAGCAVQPTLTDRLAAASDAELCEAVYFGGAGIKPGAIQESVYRGVDCQAMLPQVQMLQQQRAAAAAVRPVYQPIQIPRMEWPQTKPRPAPPQSMRCTTRNVLGTLQTDCY